MRLGLFGASALLLLGASEACPFNCRTNNVDLLDDGLTVTSTKKWSWRNAFKEVGCEIGEVCEAEFDYWKLTSKADTIVGIAPECYSGAGKFTANMPGSYGWEALGYIWRDGARTRAKNYLFRQGDQVKLILDLSGMDGKLKFEASNGVVFEIDVPLANYLFGVSMNANHVGVTTLCGEEAPCGVGSEFYVGIEGINSGSYDQEVFSMYSVDPATVEIAYYNPGLVVDIVNLPGGAGFTKSYVNLFSHAPGAVARKGFKVTSSAPISLSAGSQGTFTADTSFIYPVGALGTDYTLVSWAGGGPHYVLVATEADTDVQVYNNVGALVTSFNLPLEQSSYYNRQGADLSGYKVVANKPIAAFSGSHCLNFPGTACDTCNEMLLPDNSLGQKFIFTSFPAATGAETKYKVVAVEDSTSITITPNGGAPINIVLNAGQSYDAFSQVAADVSVVIESDKPIAAAAWIAGNNDPSQLTLTPYKYFASSVSAVTLSNSVSNINVHWLTLIVPTADIGSLSGMPASVGAAPSWTAIPGTTYSQTQYEIDQETGFSVTGSNKMMGYLSGGGPIGTYESYASQAGTAEECA